jgi:hypothetical protein
MKKEDIAKLTDWYQRILALENEILQFESAHPEIERAKEVFSDMVEELDEVRHKLRDKWNELKDK